MRRAEVLAGLTRLTLAAGDKLEAAHLAEASLDAWRAREHQGGIAEAWRTWR